MDKNSTPKRLPGTGKKSGDEGLQEKGASRLSEPLSLKLDLLRVHEDIWPEYKLPQTSGFKMARRV